MAKELITVEQASATLAKLTSELHDAATLPEFTDVKQRANGIRHLLKQQRFHLETRNAFFNLEFAARRGIGELLIVIEKNKGGRPRAEPLPGAEGFPVLDDYGLSYNASSECQYLARAPREDIDSYLAKGRGDERIELTKRGLFDHLDRLSWQQRSAEEKQKEQAEIIAEAEEAATAEPSEEIAEAAAQFAEVAAAPEPPPEPPRPPKEAGIAHKVKSLLVTAMRGGTPQEKETALNMAAKIDPNLRTWMDEGRIDPRTGLRYLQQLRDRLNEYGQRISALQRNCEDLQTKNRNLQSRERKHLELIRKLRAENERLKGDSEPAENLAEMGPVEGPDGLHIPDAAPTCQPKFTCLEFTIPELTIPDRCSEVIERIESVFTTKEQWSYLHAYIQAKL